jgi:hypothetical protein
VWIGLFLATWVALDRLFAAAPDALREVPALGRGARALADARAVTAPILGFLLGSYAIVLLGALGRWLRGEPSPCREPRPAPAPPSGVPAELRRESAISRIERELERDVRAERSGLRRAAMAVNNRLLVAGLRRQGLNDDIGCGGIVLLLVAATAALPFAAEAVARLAGLEVVGPAGALLWFALVYAAFAARAGWKALRASRSGRTAPSRRAPAEERDDRDEQELHGDPDAGDVGARRDAEPGQDGRDRGGDGARQHRR